MVMNAKRNQTQMRAHDQGQETAVLHTRRRSDLLCGVDGGWDHLLQVRDTTVLCELIMSNRMLVQIVLGISGKGMGTLQSFSRC